VISLLLDLLVVSEKGARVGAVQALAYAGTEAAAPLLRLKARLSDPEPEVVAECFTGLLQLAPEQSVSFVAEFLRAGNEAIQEAALLALGSSRRPEALEVLKTFTEAHSGDLHEVACVAPALLRLPSATEFLLTRVSDPSEAIALAALSALDVRRYDPRVRDRAAAVASSGNAALPTLFEKRFRTEEEDGSRS
jgi:HEAT repeat protein